MGSAKELVVIRRPTAKDTGVGIFNFLPDFSVVDWGPVDQFDKGSAVCMMAAYNLERLEEKRIRTHYLGLVDDRGETVRFGEIDSPTNQMKVALVNVIQPRAMTVGEKFFGYDYSVFATKDLANYLLPLEVIYRNEMSTDLNSSLFRRLKKGETTPEKLGLDHYPVPGERLSRPISDVSTKLEKPDRYMGWEEAKQISGLSEVESAEVLRVLTTVNNTITACCSAAGMVNVDGKIELAFDDKRRLMLVDVVGTQEECRMTFNGIDVGKQVQRLIYEQTAWYLDVLEAKDAAKAQMVEDWRTLCPSKPPKLDARQNELSSQIYKSVTNEYTRRHIFDVPTLAEVVKELVRYQTAAVKERNI